MRVPIIMPQLGESIAEATVVNIAVKPGDQVTADQEIIEVETNKALLQVTTPCAGESPNCSRSRRKPMRSARRSATSRPCPKKPRASACSPRTTASRAPMLDVEPGQPVPRPQRQRPSAGRRRPSPLSRRMPSDDGAAEPWPPASSPTVRSTPRPAGGGLPVPAGLSGAGYLSPRLKARLAELGLQAADLAAVAGTGAGGRVTVDDLEKFLADLEARPPQPAAAMRVAVGDAMRRSWARPLATVGAARGLDPFLAHRKGQPDPKPGMVLYAIRALALALAEEPHAAGRLIGKRLVPGGRRWTSASRSRWTAACWCPCCAGWTRSGRRTQRAVPGTRRGGAAASASARSQRQRGGDGDEFRHVRADLGDADPAAGGIAHARARRGPQRAGWDEEKGAFVPVTEAEITLSFDHRTLDGGSAGRLLARVARLMVEPEKL